MDNLDYQILTELKQNARQTASDISKTIHLSVSTVIERIKKMEKSGLIQSYTVICDDGKLGNDITVLMEISMEHPRFNDAFIVHINKDPNIIACYYLTGEFQSDDVEITKEEYSEDGCFTMPAKAVTVADGVPGVLMATAVMEPP